MGWLEFALAGLAFMSTHLIPATPRIKGPLVATLGRAGYGIAFGLLALGLLYWLILAAARAPFIELWPQEIWMRWVANIVMPVVILMSSYAIAAPNPFAFEGRASGFDPARPGIAGITRQPFLWALVLWAAAHLLVNGDLAHGILFGVFLVFSLIGMRAMERRLIRSLGPAEFARLAAQTSLIPFAALVTGRWRPTSRPSWLRLGIAVFAWAAIFHLHELVIGLNPAP
ncbi:NnrU family protein [Rhodobacter capsulatus]|uniref:NnrU family protein n=1 Tax=Rhodobacter capsulatus TaxID=1061 RepID=UPI00402518DE